MTTTQASEKWCPCNLSALHHHPKERETHKNKYGERDPINHQFSGSIISQCGQWMCLASQTELLSNPGSALDKHGNSDGSLHSQTLVYLFVH